MADTANKNHVDLPSFVTETEATFLFFYHLDMATSYFEGCPETEKLLAVFDEANADETSLTVRSQRNFIEALDSEYATEAGIDESLSAEGE